MLFVICKQICIKLELICRNLFKIAEKFTAYIAASINSAGESPAINMRVCKMKASTSKIVFTALALAATSIASFAIASGEAPPAQVSMSRADIKSHITISIAPDLPAEQPKLYASLNAPTESYSGASAKTSSTELYELAGQFSALISESRRAAQSSSLASAREIAQSVDRSPRLTRASTIDGAKAYAVLAALHSTEFRENVTRVASELGHDNFKSRLSADPNAIRQIRGYSEAKSFAAGALGDAYTIINDSSAVIRQASYDLQRQQWSKVEQAKQPRLEAIALSWNAPARRDGVQTANFATNARNNEPINDKILVAAALSAIGDDAAALNALGRDSGKFCANRAYLNLRQCLAATRYAYEHTFCLSRHGYSDFSECAQSATR